MATNIYRLIEEKQCLGTELESWKNLRCLHGHRSLVERLGFSCQLEGHRGCVNCIEWNSDGSLLASGSDDLSVIVWDPLRRKPIATVPTGHTGNIFSVKFSPSSDDSRLLLTGAEDKEVRLHDINNFETLRVWPCSQNRVKRLSVSPFFPYLCWSASEDGCVRQVDIREPHSCSDNGTCRNVLIDLKATCGTYPGTAQCKCIDINPIRPEQIAVGALDAYVRVYDTRVLSLRRSAVQVSQQGDPSCLAHFSPGHISRARSTGKSRKSFNLLAATYLSFSPDGKELLVNLSAEQVYLYDTVHFTQTLKYDYDKNDITSLPTLQSPSSLDPSLFTAPSSHIHVGGIVEWTGGACLDPSVSVSRLKEQGVELYRVENFTGSIQVLNEAIEMCPSWHLLFLQRAAALFGRKWEGDIYAALRDAETALALCPSSKKAQQRRLRCLSYLGWEEETKRFLRCYQNEFPQDREFHRKIETDLAKNSGGESGSKNGFRSDKQHISQWEIARQRSAYDYKTRYCGHCNTHTDIKEASFIGDQGDYIAAGSDDGNIFIWEKSTGNLVRILHGDDSIVNCVQWHPRGAMMASSGIESVVRLWEPKCPDEDDPRVVPNVLVVSRDNQERMRVDPFEVMLMRMGFRIASQQREAAAQHDVLGHPPPPRGGGGSEGQGVMDVGDVGPHREGGEEEDDPAGARWIQDPSYCRQS